MLGLLGAAIVVWALVVMAGGQNLGHLFLGLQVVDHRGEPVGFWRMVFREVIGKLISGLVCSLGYLWVAIDKDRRGWHDMMGNTYVVKKS